MPLATAASPENEDVDVRHTSEALLQHEASLEAFCRKAERVHIEAPLLPSRSPPAAETYLSRARGLGLLQDRQRHTTIRCNRAAHLQEAAPGEALVQGQKLGDLWLLG